MKALVRWVSLIAFVLAAVWVYKEPKIEAWIIAATTLGAFLATFLAPESSASGQSQRVTGGSQAFQAGRDIKNSGNRAGDDA
ncbi:MAG TPA: hypothetical protein VIN75_25025 [Burkholderiaceae bacterium]